MQNIVCHVPKQTWRQPCACTKNINVNTQCNLSSNLNVKWTKMKVLHSYAALWCCRDIHSLLCLSLFTVQSAVPLFQHHKPHTLLLNMDWHRFTPTWSHLSLHPNHFHYQVNSCHVCPCLYLELLCVDSVSTTSVLLLVWLHSWWRNMSLSTVVWHVLLLIVLGQQRQIQYQVLVTPIIFMCLLILVHQGDMEELTSLHDTIQYSTPVSTKLYFFSHKQENANFILT